VQQQQQQEQEEEVQSAAVVADGGGGGGRRRGVRQKVHFSVLIEEGILIAASDPRSGGGALAGRHTSAIQAVTPS
jgi:hypothetical protein